MTDTSLQTTYLNSKGEKVIFPKRWTRRWLESLSMPDLILIQVKLTHMEYWGEFNPNTREARNLLLYQVLEEKRRGIIHDSE